ncbi:hypothetical protein [Rathayibacter sp. AY2B9]|uniref:hypothetical protein n=1 Tax=Rathayibacter sp. AY2B9 TaxID=2080572 RepID=UPI000CE928F5|nr:hypothetical protein [Rathayibacter sp. AY2B9]PPG34536.1 hypothetical protein C5C25_00500 [Rathayibacter sp. AY2B9]
MPPTSIPATPAANSTDWRPFIDAIAVAVKELQSGGVAEQTVGYLNAADPKWGLTPWDPDAPVINDITALANAAHAQKKAIVVPNLYKIGSTTSASNFNDKNMHLIGGGVGGFVGEGNTLVRQLIAPSPNVEVLDFSVKTVGVKNKHTANFFDVPAADLQKFCADMAWQVVASGAVRSGNSTATDGFFSWSLPGTTLHDLLSNGDTPRETGKAVMAEALTILGVTFLISGTTTLVEDDTLTGATSGAKMKIEAYGEDYNGSSNKRVVARRVIGTFQVGENVARKGTVVGKIAADGQVVTKGTTLYDWSKVTVARSLRKLGGSQGGYAPSTKFPAGDYFSNLISRTDGMIFDTTTDPDASGITRAAAVDIRGAVHGRYEHDVFKSGYRNAYRIASPHGGKVSGAQILRLPNASDSTEGGYGYGVELEGTAHNFLVEDCVFSNVRHGVTTNPTGNTGYLTAVGDTLRHGIQRFIYVVDCKTEDTYAPGFDTHHGADSVFFIGCKVNGVISGGEKDSDFAGFQTRSSNTWFIDCISIGACAGFTDPTAGFTVPQGNPNPNGGTWPLAPIHSRTTYINCQALDYEEIGFRQGLAAESIHHSAVYVGCLARAKKDARYPTVGMRLTGVTTWIIDPIFQENSLAMIDIEQGSYYGPTPSTRVKATIGVIGDTFADFSLAPTDDCGLINVAGSSSGVLTLALAGNVDVVQKAGVTGMPAAWVNVTGGALTVKGTGEIRNLTGTTAIPLTKKASAASVTTATIPTTSWR